MGSEGLGREVAAQGAEQPDSGLQVLQAHLQQGVFGLVLGAFDDQQGLEVGRAEPVANLRQACRLPCRIDRSPVQVVAFVQFAGGAELGLHILQGFDDGFAVARGQFLHMGLIEMQLPLELTTGKQRLTKGADGAPDLPATQGVEAAEQV